MRYTPFAATVFLLMIAVSSTAQVPEVSHVWPSEGLNERQLTLHVYGDSLVEPITAVKLISSVNPELTADSVNVVSDKHLTCSFGLSGSATGLYGLLVSNSSGSDTLKACFSIYSSSPAPYSWERTTVGSGDDRMYAVALGDGDNDGEMEVYGASRDGSVYQFEGTAPSGPKPQSDRAAA